MKISDFSSLFIARTVAALMCLLHSRWKRRFKNVLLLKIVCVMPCVRGNFLKVKSRGNKNKYVKIVILSIHFATLFLC
jgi:hypothetical protein